MSLLDQGLYAAVGLAKQKLPARVSQAVDLGERLLRRAIAAPTSRIPSLTPGLKSTLEAARARKDPLMNFNWWADMPILDGTQRLSWEYVEEGTLPFIEFEQQSNYRAGKNYHYAHHYALGTLSLKLYEDSDGISLQYISKWQSLIHNSDSGLYYFPDQYKKTISIWVLDVSKMTAMCLEYTGCWPMRVNAHQYSSASSERITTDVEFSVDELRCKFIKLDSQDIPSIVSQVGEDFPQNLTALPDLFPSQSVNFSFGA